LKLTKKVGNLLDGGHSYKIKAQTDAERTTYWAISLPMCSSLPNLLLLLLLLLARWHFSLDLF